MKPQRIFIVLALLATGCSVFNHNFHTVEPDVLYRSGQIPDHRLSLYIDQYGIKTVVNLRGAETDEDWYAEEVAVCEMLGVTHHSLDWSMNRLPDPESLAQLLDWYETADKPILVHCQGGTHRAGIASSAYVLREGGDVKDARGQLGFWFMGAGIGEVLDLYDGNDRPFTQWVREDYPALYDEAIKR